MNTVKRVTLEDELKRNPELKMEDLQRLKDWYSKQPHYPQNMTDPEFVMFLHSNYYRLEPTKTTIENFLTSRTHTPEVFSNRDPLGSKELRLAMGTILVLPLEEKTPEGYTVIYSRLLNFDPDKFNYADSLRLYNMIGELWAIENYVQKGYVLIADIIGSQMSHAMRVPPMALKKQMFYLQEAVPIRLKSMHFLNTNSVMDYIMRLVKPFLKKELLEMVHLHPNLDSLAKHMSTDILPNEAGGKAGPMVDLYNKVIKNLEDHRDYFIEEEATRRVNEALRPGKAKSASDVFGIEGSFKKLDID